MEHPPRKLSDLVLYGSEQTVRIPVLWQGDLAQRNPSGGAGNDGLAWFGNGCSASRMKRIENIRGCAHPGVWNRRCGGKQGVDEAGCSRRLTIIRI